MYGKYLINVPYVFSKTITYAGAKIIYRHKSMKYKDVLEIRGPSNEALRVVVGYRCFAIQFVKNHKSGELPSWLVYRRESEIWTTRTKFIWWQAF